VAKLVAAKAKAARISTSCFVKLENPIYLLLAAKVGVVS
jgi:hypothetical protein